MIKKKIKKSTIKKDKIYILMPIVFFILYGLLDYINISSILKIKINNINMDLLSIFFDSLVVIILYIVTYFHIDKKRILKDANSEKVANVLMRQTYLECLDNLKLINNKQMLKEFIVPKVDFDKTDSENKVVVNLQNLPFKSYDNLMNLAISGYVSENRLDKYLWIKKEYAYIISIKITFYDLEVPKNKVQREMLDDITKRYNQLNIEITQELTFTKK